MTRASLADEIAAVRAICSGLGFGDVSPTLLKAAHRTSLLISSLATVARVQSVEPLDEALQRSTRELAVTRHLAGRGAPVVRPLDERRAGPFVVAPSVVTLWSYVPHDRTADEADAALAATALAEVHEGLRDYGGALPPYTLALDRCGRVLDSACLACSDDDRTLLTNHYRRLRRETEAAVGGWVPLHGDAHLGNVLPGPRGPLWGDFEDACRGPRAYDVATLPSAAWLLFADVDQALVARFADLRSVCVAVWCLADMSRSPEIREAADHHLQSVRAFGP